MKVWQTVTVYTDSGDGSSEEQIIRQLLEARGFASQTDIDAFLHPADPSLLTPKDVGISPKHLAAAVTRIGKAIAKKESVVVYADYDADGITAGAVMWETLWKLGARVMPYIPHREEEGYGLSRVGVDAVREQYDPALIITVDHGITAYENVAYAKKLGIDVIVTDHHVAPGKLPECPIVHTTQLSGSGVSWFTACTVAEKYGDDAVKKRVQDLVSLAVFGTIADLVPLVSANRSVAAYGLEQMRRTRRVGLLALLADAGVEKSAIETYTISHMLAPRLNAMGRIEHALDALRLLCTTDHEKAILLAQKRGLTNKTRQKMTEDTVVHASGQMPKDPKSIKKLIFLAHESYNQGIIGLVAGKMTETYYRPSVVVSVGEEFSKGSARSIAGFNIIEAIRMCSDLLVDAGGHPMAAGFTIETKNLGKFQKKLEGIAEKTLDDGKLTRVLHVDMEIPIAAASVALWKRVRQLAPFGIGNPQPVFATRGVAVSGVRMIGATRKHLKFKVRGKASDGWTDAIAFNMADRYGMVTAGKPIDIAYTVDMNEWNGTRSLQYKIRDIRVHEE